MSRRITKASKRRLSFFGPIFVFFIVYFIFSLFYNAYSIYDLTKQKKELEYKYTELQEEAKQLKIDIDKLNDEQYLANYARENYSYSKDGEYIIKMKEDSKQTLDAIDSITFTINKDYIIIISGILLLLIIIYSKISKNKRAKK